MEADDIIRAELSRREAERKALEDERVRNDPLTWYNANPIENYFDEQKGVTYRLGPGPTALKCMLDQSKYRMLEGGNRSGKTVGLLAETSMYARGLHPARPWTIPPRLLVLITSRQQAKSVWQDRLLVRSKFFGPAEHHPLLPEWCLAVRRGTRNTRPVPDIDYTYMGSVRLAQRVGLANGAEIFFYWSGANDSWTRIEGMDFDAIVMDETLKDSPASGQLVPELKLRLLDAQCHPEKPHAGWFLWGATDTKANTEFKEFRELAQSGMDDAAYYKIGPGENPAISFDARVQMAKTMGSEDAAVRLFGEGGYGDRFLVLARHFSLDKHVVKKAYAPNDTDNLFVFLDPAFGRTGSNHGIILAALSKDAPTVYRIIAEDARKNCSVEEQVQIIAEMLTAVGRDSLEAVVIDPAAAKTESTGESVQTQYRRYFKLRGVKLERGILPGRNRKDDTYPMIINAFREGRVEINPECAKLVKQINEARSKDPTKYSGPMGVIDKKLDVLAAFRYGISRNLYWIDRGRQNMHAPQPPSSSDMVLEITDDMSDDMKLHITRLRQSMRNAARFTRPSTYLPVRRLR